MSAMSLQFQSTTVDQATSVEKTTDVDKATGLNKDSGQRIIEFVFPGEARQQLSLILPMLAHLTNSGDELGNNNDQLWLTCIGPQLLAKKDCRRYRLNWQRLLQVLPSQKCAMIDLAERALLAGKSHTVVCVVNELTGEQLARLERAAGIGNCQGIVIRGR